MPGGWNATLAARPTAQLPATAPSAVCLRRPRRSAIPRRGFGVEVVGFARMGRVLAEGASLAAMGSSDHLASLRGPVSHSGRGR